MRRALTGQPVLVDRETGEAYGPADILPDGRLAREVMQELAKDGE